MCEYCQKVRDDNEPLIWDEDKNGELQNFVEIRYKHGQFELWSGICFIKINFCPMCGRDLTEGENTVEMKPVIRAHAIIDWLGNCKCSNCGNIDLNSTEPYCQHCGANLDEPEEREE